MIHGLLADLVVTLHAGFVVFVVFGGLLALRWPRAALVHVPASLWGAWVELAGRICPLTPLEIRLRVSAGEAGYTGSFIERYLLPILYPGALTREIQLALGVAVVLLNFAVYGWVIRRWRKAAESGPAA